MKRKLATIVKELTEEDIQELIRMKKTDDKKTLALRKKRDKVAAELARIDAELEKAGATPARRGRKAAAKPGRKPASAAGKRSGKKRVNFTAAVREVFARVGTPLRAADVVEGLPDVGIKVKDVADMRKRVSVVLASQKSSFEMVERGVYQIKA